MHLLQKCQICGMFLLDTLRLTSLDHCTSFHVILEIFVYIHIFQTDLHDYLLITMQIAGCRSFGSCCLQARSVQALL